MFVIPTITNPASLKRRTTYESLDGRKSPNRSEPNVSGRPSTGVRSLIPIGTPANGRSSPGPMASAAASARSASTATKAFTVGLSASIRSRDASTSSREVTSPWRTRSASSVTGRKRRSAAAVGVIRAPVLGSREPNLQRCAADEIRKRASMSEVQSGLEGVVAFATEIAEPDKEGSALRYRGIDIEDLVGQVPFEKVWGLLVDGDFEPGLAPAEPHPLTIRSGDPRVDVQSALAMLAPEWGLRQLIDIPDRQAREDLARACVMALSFVAQSARGPDRPPVPQDEVDRAASIPERFLIRWRGDADPKHVQAIDAYWISAAEHARARVLRRTCQELGSPRFEVAEALEAAALAELQARKPDRVLATNVEFWSAVVLDLAEVPPQLFTSMFTCARTAGWAAHILEQKREGRLIRPTAKYVGPGPRPVPAAA